MKTSKGAIMDQGMDMALMIVISIFIIGAGSIGIAGLYSGVDRTTATGGNLTGPAVGNGSTALLNYSMQMPSIGTLAGVALLLIVLFGAFYMFLKRE